jgi:hypothetical protein
MYMVTPAKYTSAQRNAHLRGRQISRDIVKCCENIYTYMYVCRKPVWRVTAKGVGGVYMYARITCEHAENHKNKANIFTMSCFVDTWRLELGASFFAMPPMEASSNGACNVVFTANQVRAPP